MDLKVSLPSCQALGRAGAPHTAAEATFEVTTTPDATILLQWTAIKDQAIVGAIEIYGPAGASYGPVFAPEAAVAPVSAPAAAPGLAPPVQTLPIPNQPYAPAFAPSTAPVVAPAPRPHAYSAYAPLLAPPYGSTFLQVSIEPRPLAHSIYTPFCWRGR